MVMDVYIVFCSPAGTTRHVADVLARRCDAPGGSVTACDVGAGCDGNAIIDAMRDRTEPFLLFVGSPVYACHAVPPIARFLEQLPFTTQGHAVPFVTWGGVTSGIALFEMATVLLGKGFHLQGAAKILAEHSMMWQCAHPLGEGHPDASDDALMADLAATVMERINGGTEALLPLHALAYQGREAHEAMKTLTLEMARQMLPQRETDPRRCTQCRVCVENCPAGAITIDPDLHFAPSCFICYNCVRLCPEQAIRADCSMMEGWLRNKSAEMPEPPTSAVFLEQINP